MHLLQTSFLRSLPPAKLSRHLLLTEHGTFVDGFCLFPRPAKLLLGDALQEGKPIAVNPVALAAWSALTVNALQLIPVGELDGGRLALGIFGRKVRGYFFPGVSPPSFSTVNTVKRLRTMTEVTCD